MPLPVEQVVVFRKGGKVLWSRGKAKDVVNSWIGSVLLEEKGGDLRATIESYTVEWRLANDVDSVLVLVYNKSMELDFGGELLERLRSAVRKQPRELDKSYDRIASDLEARPRRVAPAPAPARREEEEEGEGEEEDEEEAAAEVSVEEKLRRRGVGTKGGRRKKKEDEKPTKKQPKVWRDTIHKRTSAAQVAELDYSKKEEASDASMATTYLPADGERAAWEEDEEEKKSGSWLSSLMESAAGTATLTADRVEPIMAQLRERLVAKNVAAEIATEVCESVATTLAGKKLGRFERARGAVKDALAAAVERVLTPKRSTDVLREVLAAKERQKPYVIVFVGINGVGKSTTLSKVAYYLKSHGLDVGIAACDTFRSGAVEQLRSHAKCLGVDLFERGYLKDPAQVAKAAIDDAAKKKRDCVLVDTAGRMQNNDKLMRELAKLVTLNEPDLVLFVGEALVGNDGISQITLFNRALANFSPTKRQIDGLVLTKFDCIDDKVGAALSVTYATGQPIVFIGVGQKYTHLKKLSVTQVLNALFS
ncbi:hypothetical protein CTAYLR_000125 [Chrysophaeum taylorii]|uniref:SRP54-type proteins GTP-binding domain-containing protein n=1 Tax=Chrysophaeum taylorii TaxID=2483200 RepID=A0AAD7UHI5_9STRA|nr:hypothetical protein CTAYLR_000125 [Chrysophaeum taylorii]